jgi:hypothetical protein
MMYDANDKVVGSIYNSVNGGTMVAVQLGDSTVGVPLDGSRTKFAGSDRNADRLGSTYTRVYASIDCSGDPSYTNGAADHLLPLMVVGKDQDISPTVYFFKEKKLVTVRSVYSVNRCWPASEYSSDPDWADGVAELYASEELPISFTITEFIAPLRQE